MRGLLLNQLLEEVETLDFDVCFTLLLDHSNNLVEFNKIYHIIVALCRVFYYLKKTLHIFAVCRLDLNNLDYVTSKQICSIQNIQLSQGCMHLDDLLVTH